MTRNVYFKVAYADGSHHFEHKDGDWSKAVGKGEITALGLYTKTGRNFNLPSNYKFPLESFLQKHPKWRWIKIHFYQGFVEFKVDGLDDLLGFIKEEIKGKAITGIQFFDFEGQSKYLALESENPKYQAFFESKVEGFDFYRKAGVDLNNENIVGVDNFAVVTAHYKNYSLQIWVSEERPENSWSLVVER